MGTDTEAISCDALAARVVGVLRRHRFPVTAEKETQAQIAAAFARDGVVFAREVRLGDGDIVDFLVEGGLAIEVKLRAPKRAVHRQCVRYLEHERVRALLLVTAGSIGFPPEIAGKPCYVLNLGRAWL